MIRKVPRLKNILAAKKFIIVASLPQNDPAMAQAAFAAGADAVKLHLNVHHYASGTRFGSWTQEKNRIRKILSQARGAVGLMPGAEKTASPAELGEAITEGISFIDIYDFDMPSWMLELPVSRMGAAGAGYTLERVKALEYLGLDCLEASILSHSDYGKRLSARDLEDYYLLCRATRKPVLVPSQKKLVPADIPWLKKTGVRGILLGAICMGKNARSIAASLPAFVNAVGAV